MTNSPDARRAPGIRSAVHVARFLADGCAIMLPCLLLLLAGDCAAEQASARPLQILLVTSGGYHDYKTLAPFLTNHLQ